MYIDIQNVTEFKSVQEYVNTKSVISIPELKKTVLEYLNKFEIDVVKRLGYEL